MQLSNSMTTYLLELIRESMLLGFTSEDTTLKLAGVLTQAAAGDLGPVVAVQEAPAPLHVCIVQLTAALQQQKAWQQWNDDATQQKQRNAHSCSA